MKKDDDMRPSPGQDGQEVDRRFKPGTTFESQEDILTQLKDAVEADFKVDFEVQELLNDLHGWLTRKAMEARSKPARDLLYELEDWAEQYREDHFS